MPPLDIPLKPELTGYVLASNLNSTRRNFLLGAAASASALTIGSNALKASSHSAQSKEACKGKQISVDHEWGTLKEAVVGLTNLRVPSEIPPSIKNYLPKTSIDFTKKNKGQ